MTIRRIHRSESSDRGSLLKTHIITIMEMNWPAGMPGTITTFHKRGTIKRAQPCQDRKMGAGTFSKSQSPAILNLLKNGRWTFDNCYLVVIAHLFTIVK